MLKSMQAYAPFVDDGLPKSGQNGCGWIEKPLMYINILHNIITGEDKKAGEALEMCCRRMHNSRKEERPFVRLGIHMLPVFLAEQLKSIHKGFLANLSHILFVKCDARFAMHLEEKTLFSVLQNSY